MCGISGIYTPERLVSRAQLATMNRLLRHRGPDSSGLWADNDIGLAHTRLQILDLSQRAAQPMVSADQKICLTYNGEIYNYKQIRRTLAARGVVFRSNSDTEVLLEGYAAYGEDIITRLEGMFAFALWDIPRRRLVLARDRAGEKPLYYRKLPGNGIAFASEIKALLGIFSDLTPNYERIPEYLLYGYAPHPYTFYREVHSLLPGQMLSVGQGQSGEPRTYWRPAFTGTSKLSYAEAKDSLRWRMRDVVRDRLAADVPVGAFLSGGLDSATVVGVASRDLGHKVYTFSIGFDERNLDESGDARKSAAHLGSIHQEFIVGPRDMPSVQDLVNYLDEPLADASVLPTFLVSKMARQHVTVALTGDGGDEIFGGYPRFVGGALAERLPRMLGLATKKVAERAYSMSPQAFKSSIHRAKRLAAAVERPLAERILHWNAIFPPQILADILRPELRPSLSNMAAFSDQIFARSVGRTTVSRMLEHNFLTYLPCDLLTKVDRCAMAVGLETRCPLLDSGLVTFVASLPDNFKIHGLSTKRILRETFADLFAPGLVKRPKRGFGIPLVKWLQGPLKAQMEEAIRPSQARIYDFVDFHAVERLLFTKDKPWRLPHGSQAWALWMLEVWLRRTLP